MPGMGPGHGVMPGAPGHPGAAGMPNQMPIPPGLLSDLDKVSCEGQHPLPGQPGKASSRKHQLNVSRSLEKRIKLKVLLSGGMASAVDPLMQTSEP